MSVSADLAAAGSARDLVPGDPPALHDLAAALSMYADDLDRAGQGFASLVPSNWSGRSAESFRRRFGCEPGRWQAAADGFAQAAQAVSTFATALALAQLDAGDALARWRRAATLAPSPGSGPYGGVTSFTPPPTADPGAADRAIAINAVNDAQERVTSAGRSAALAVRQATHAAPADPSWWQSLVATAVGLTEAGASLAYNAVAVPGVNAAASVGSAFATNPGAAAEMIGGVLLIGVSGLGDGAGATLSATGVGAVGGVPLAAVSTAGIAAGVGYAAVGAAGLGATAAANPVQILYRNDQGPERSSAPTPDGDRITAELAKLPRGRNAGVSEVPTEGDLERVWDSVSRGGRDVPAGSPNVRRVLMPDGTYVSWRPSSHSGGATIDVTTSDGRHFKVHLPVGSS